MLYIQVVQEPTLHEVVRSESVCSAIDSSDTPYKVY